MVCEEKWTSHTIQRWLNVTCTCKLFKVKCTDYMRKGVVKPISYSIHTHVSHDIILVYDIKLIFYIVASLLCMIYTTVCTGNILSQFLSLSVLT